MKLNLEDLDWEDLEKDLGEHVTFLVEKRK